MPPSLPPLRWGILGCGVIAEAFARDLVLVPGQTLHAVASATPGKAAAFAQRHGVPTAVDRYQDLIGRDDVDVVYVATTHDLHHGHARLALEGGKAVLCEKPLTVNRRQAEDLIRVARERGVFLMEAWWTRFFPAIEEVLAMVRDGALGPVRMVQADFGVAGPWAPDHRMVDPNRAGGALLDLGVYPVSLAHLLFGQAPTTIHGHLRPTPGGVDAQSSVLLGFPDGGQALLSAAVDLRMPHQARVFGPEGAIIIDEFFHPAGFVVQPRNGEPRRWNFPFAGRGYQFEVAEVATCLGEGRLESPRRPLADTVAVLETLDVLRRSWGLVYPGECVGPQAGDVLAPPAAPG